MKILLGVLLGGAAGFVVSRYVLPAPPMALTCGSRQVVINADGTVTSGGITVPVTGICNLLPF